MNRIPDLKTLQTIHENLFASGFMDQVWEWDYDAIDPKTASRRDLFYWLKRQMEPFREADSYWKYDVDRFDGLARDFLRVCVRGESEKAAPRPEKPPPASEEKAPRAVHHGTKANPPKPASFPPKRTEPARALSRCPDRVRGYENDGPCGGCRDAVDCQHKTLRRLLAVARDWNTSLGKHTDHRIDADGMVEWETDGSDLIPYPETIAVLRKRVRDAADAWARGVLDRLHSEAGLADAKDAKRLKGQTRASLCHLTPAWKELEEGVLGGRRLTVPHPDEVNLDDAKGLEALGWHVRLPYWVLEHYVFRMGPAETRVFLYLTERATFDAASPRFGQCWLSFAEIEDGARVGRNSVGGVVKRLRDLGAIDVEHIRRGQDGRFTTLNHFTVNYLLKMRDLGLWAWKPSL